METSEKNLNESFVKRQRLHEILIALIKKQDDFELMDHSAPTFDSTTGNLKDQDPARWLDRNRRVLKTYQSLVRSAITLEALLDAEYENHS